MNLLNMEFLWNLLWIIPLFCIVSYYGWRRREKLLGKFLGEGDRDSLVNLSKGKRILREVILLCVVLLVCLAAARPSWGKQILPYTGEGRDLLILFDTSKSMLCQDVEPNRLEHAKWLVRELVRLNPGDRFGLIAFAGTSFLECPLTVDKTSFLNIVNDLSTDTIPVGGTNIQKALEEALIAFQAAEGTHKGIILISDGDELEGRSSDVVNTVVEQKIPLIIAGVGDPGKPSIIHVPDGRGGYTTLKDASGNPVNSPLNEAQMSELARRTGGLYVRSTAADSGLKEIEARIRAIIPQKYGEEMQTRPIERAVYPLVAALILLCVWFCLSERNANRSTALRPSNMILLFIPFFLLSGFSLSAQDAGNTSPEAVPLEKNRANELRKVLAESNDPVQLFNAGVERQVNENDPKDAVAYYEKAIKNSSEYPQIRAGSYQNMGVMNHNDARSAMERVQQSLAAQNLDQAEKEIAGALQKFDGAEELYREGMRYSQDSLNIVQNQQNLLKDRASAEELKQKIEELKKQRQEAQEQAQKALEQQRKENQQQKQDQQKQDDKNQQGQKDEQKQQQGQNQDKQDGENQAQDQDKQNGQNQENQQGGEQSKSTPSQSASEQTENARKQAEELARQAESLSQQDMKDAAKKAAEELDKAQQEQKKGDGNKAEEHLKDALKKLGGKDSESGEGEQNPQEQNEGQNKEQDQKNQQPEQGENSENKQSGEPKESDSDKELPLNEAGQAEQGNPADEKEIDPKQAQALLNLMAEDEKKLRDALKERQKMRYGRRPVQKDW